MKIFILLLACVAIGIDAKASLYDYNSFQSAVTTSRPFGSIVSTPVPSLYNSPYINSVPYNSYQSITTLRPYISQYGNLGSTPVPFYNQQYGVSQLYNPYQINSNGIYNQFYDYGYSQSLLPGSYPYQFSNQGFGSLPWSGRNGGLISYPYTGYEYGYYPQIFLLSVVAIAVDAEPSPYGSFITSSTTIRPSVAVVTTPTSTILPSLRSSIVPLPYNSYQSVVTTRRPFIASTPIPTSFPLYNRPYQTSISTLGATAVPFLNSQYPLLQSYSPYQIGGYGNYNWLLGQGQGLFPGSYPYQFGNNFLGALPWSWTAGGNGFYPQATLLAKK